ncbi:NADP-dependent malic enzyme-like [Olea europaea subsp. europaea]|uniref:NADP-dependent malic enzyme-like n=1 Tax=Olea europaea subsp. europaea TaxID=158383 RepID=A0A8S0UIW2_OLEEU|nr:NADP-dependent malic enzyme-like [Olea europaea subsp. europaea]
MLVLRCLVKSFNFGDKIYKRVSSFQLFVWLSAASFLERGFTATFVQTLIPMSIFHHSIESSGLGRNLYCVGCFIILIMSCCSVKGARTAIGRGKRGKKSVYVEERNQRLYYRFLIQNVEELLQVVYTPTVVEAFQKYFRQPEGTFISLKKKKKVKNSRGIEKWA